MTFSRPLINQSACVICLSHIIIIFIYLSVFFISLHVKSATILMNIFKQSYYTYIVAHPKAKAHANSYNCV